MARSKTSRGDRVRRAAKLILAILLVGPDVGLAAGNPDGDAAATLFKEIHLPTVGPLGAVSVVGDSVLLGSGIWSPTLPDRLVENGFGPVRFVAAVGHKAGLPTSWGSSNASTYSAWWIRHWRAIGWYVPNVFVNLGANDSGICTTNIACAKQRIEDLVDYIGPGHKVWWPKITQTSAQASWAVAWNAALDQVAAERADFFTWDWPAEMSSGGYPSTDNIHLSVDGYRRRSAWMAAAFTADLARIELRLSVVGLLGGVSVVGDSVLLGSGSSVPSLPDRLVGAGWGPVWFRGAVGLGAGPPVGEDAAAWWIAQWRSEGWDAPNVIVNVGADDAGVCGSDQVCAKGRIVAVVDAIGVGHRVWWPKITHPDAAAAVAWNAALDEVAAERAEFFTWDWPAAMADGGYPSPDGVHLSVAGYVARSAQLASVFTHDLTRSTRVGGDVALPIPTAAPSRYQPLTPVRVTDTRPSGRQPAGSVLGVDFGARLPDGATAVAVNVTATQATQAGYLAAGPCGTGIGGSTVNYTTGVDRGAMAVIPLGTGDDICVFTSATTDIVVDLQGVFVDGPGTGFTPVPPTRMLDTRPTSPLIGTLIVNTPPDATAVAINLTVDQPAAAGWLRAAPCDTPTDVSNVNYQPGEAVAGAAYVTTSPDNTICITTSATTHVLVDLTGTFGDDGLSFTPVPPTRMLDTRQAIGGWTPIHGNNQILDIRVTPPDAQAATGTITEVAPLTAGYLTATPCPTPPTPPGTTAPTPPTPPLTSSVNANTGLTLANSLTTAVSPTGTLCIYANPTTHTLFDITGWWTP